MAPKRRPTKHAVSQKQTSDTEVCLFCQLGSCPENDLIGPVYSKDGIFAHKNCLYFSASLTQQEGANTECEGADELFFFPIEDIRREAKRSVKLKCSFCRHSYASAGCVNNKCKKKFHFPCGLKNNVLFCFNDFSSACKDHQARQEPHPVDDIDAICNICHDEIETAPNGRGVPNYDQIYCPSCFKWLHRNCMQHWALKAGLHHLRCPMCNNAQPFNDELIRLGFELPDRDAEWEREGMYREHEEGTLMTCSAEKCICDKGREYSDRKGMQELIACKTCGENAVHRQCIDEYSLELSKGSLEIWRCDICELVELIMEAQSRVQEKYRQRKNSQTTTTAKTTAPATTAVKETASAAMETDTSSTGTNEIEPVTAFTKETDLAPRAISVCSVSSADTLDSTEDIVMAKKCKSDSSEIFSSPKNAMKVPNPETKLFPLFTRKK